MLSICRITGGRFGLRAGYDAGRRAPRRRRRDLRVEALEGRALLSLYIVDNPGDSGTGIGLAGDLRYAINQADQATGNSTILFAPTLDRQTIALGLGPLMINKPSGTLTIQGPGADKLSISGGHRFEDLAISPLSKVSISGLTLTDGIAAQGGAISNTGELTLSACTITGNSAMGSGGGGIVNGPFGTMTIDESTIEDNTSALAGGGGITNAGTMTIVRSTVNGNACRGGGTSGGGIANTGVLTIDDGTVSGNQAVSGDGGGIFNTHSLTMADDTVSNNSAGMLGGGIANRAGQGGSVTMDNTIVAGNVSALSASLDDVFDNGNVVGSLVGGNDLVESGDVGMLTNTITGVDPMLGPLQDNGGRTLTQALLPGSPAIGAGNVALVPAGIWTDQRGIGYARVVNGQLDIGAFEIQGPRGIDPTPSPPHAPPIPLRADAIAMGLTIVPPSPSSQGHQGLILTIGA
jgi:hypothetical protein